MYNVAGEILGSMAAVEKAIELGVKSVDIYFDYMGIRAWALGEGVPFGIVLKI
jgi:ribonuclease HI